MEASINGRAANFKAQKNKKALGSYPKAFKARKRVRVPERRVRRTLYI